jgi:hypothetical protein
MVFYPVTEPSSLSFSLLTSEQLTKLDALRAVNGHFMEVDIVRLLNNKCSAEFYNNCETFILKSLN